MDNRDYIKHLAAFLIGQGTNMNADDLVQHLNWNGLQTTYGTEYAGGRGIYKLIAATYHWLEEQGKDVEADAVSKAFRKPDGTYAYQQ